MRKRLLLVGNPENIHVGGHLVEAAASLGVETRLCDSRQAFAAPRWLSLWNWHMRGQRPSRLRDFGESVAAACRDFAPDGLLTTGIAPVETRALMAIGEMGIARLNFLTDDPWNPAHRAPWFMEALPHYDQVFSPRRSNLGDLMECGCGRASYLPFAYAPSQHFPGPPQSGLASDVIFVGGADRDRRPIIAALIAAGMRVALYGGYWDRFRETRAFHRGHADPQTLRQATAAAKIALCLVRRANRDGHVMRSFEIPAMGACMLAEDTEEHREIFGPNGEAVVYFRSIPGMIEKARRLLKRPGERQRLARAAHARITGGRNTYADRLADMLARTTDPNEDRHSRTRTLSRV